MTFLLLTPIRYFRLASKYHNRKGIYLKNYTIPLRNSKSYCSHLKTEEKQDDFKIVYRFPYIVVARLICKFKLYQTSVVIGLSGFSVFTDVQLIAPLVFCSCSLLLLGVMGEYFRKLVGIVYVNPDTSQVKIAHLNFWGNRENIICSLDDIIPFSDLGDDVKDIYVRIRFYNKPFSFNMSIRYGLIVNPELFKKVFGHIH